MSKKSQILNPSRFEMKNIIEFSSFFKLDDLWQLNIVRAREYVGGKERNEAKAT